MKLINNPDRSQWAEILKRPVMNTENLFDTVRGIIDRVKSDGDRAVLEMEAKFDKAELTSLAVTEAELKEAETLVDEKLKAAIRLGMAFASTEIIGILSKIKYPYNVNQLTQKQAIEMLHKYYEIERWVKRLKEEREDLENRFSELPLTVKVFPSDANFFLARVTDAVKIYNYLVGEGIIVRNRNSISLCGNCLRVTVGTRMENDKLIEALKSYE